MLNRGLDDNYLELIKRLAAIRMELSELISQAIKDPSVRHKNNHLVKCWEVKCCDKTNCPSYGDEKNLRCWQVSGTYCGGQAQGDFAHKYGDCRRCEVFKVACASELDSIGEEFNNLLHLLQGKSRRLEVANKELREKLKKESRMS